MGNMILLQSSRGGTYVFGSFGNELYDERFEFKSHYTSAHKEKYERDMPELLSSPI